jgi:divalent metal cation (Fe/Co/Zn/Cd) transporter
VSILIAVFIAWSAVEISRPTLDELLERSLSDSDVEAISKIISETDGVRHFHRLRTRRVGHSAIVDVHIKVDPDITVTAGHEIATAVERRLRSLFSSDIISNIHIEPLKHLE